MDRPPGGSREEVNSGGSSGSTERPSSKKFYFGIILTMLNKINKQGLVQLIANDL